MKWINVNIKLPPINTLVEVKRDFTDGIGGGIGRFEWLTKGRLRDDKPTWSIKKVEELTLNNSYPTHWREIRDKKK